MNIRDRIKELRRVPGRELRANPLNFRKHPTAQRSALAGVLEQIGIAAALIARETPDGLELIDGHLRAEDYGDAEWPVLVLDVTADEARLLLATLDPLSALAEHDSETLKKLVGSLDPAVAILAKAAHSTDTLRKLFEPLAGQCDPDDVPEAPGDPVTQMGDLWQLGSHRLICGDCTDAETVERLMGGKRAQLMITDPPYGVNLDQTWRDKALGDKKMGPGNANLVENDDRADWSEAWALFEGDVAYIWHADRLADVVMASLRASRFEIRQQLIWNKTILVMGRSDYQFKHEPCWYAVRKGRGGGWIGDRKQTTVIDAASPNHIMSGSKEEKTAHPTQKPAELMLATLKNHKGDVYDPFAGSGTTLIAAEQLGRRCYAIEISPAYCDIIVARWEKFTGKKAERLNP